MSDNVTNVVNACGFPLKVCYSRDRLQLEAIDLAVGGTAALSPSVSGGTKIVMKRNSAPAFLRIPVNDYGQILDMGAIFVTVFVEYKNNRTECISENFNIPKKRSFIVTANRSIKFQKRGADLGVDQDDQDHWAKKRSK